EQHLDLAVALDRVEHRRLHRLFGHVKLAQLVPAFGHLGEIGRRLFLLRGPDRGEPLHVADAVRTVRLEPADQPARQVAPCPVRRQPVIGPGALCVAGNEASVGEELEVARDARLALAENLGEILDRMLALAQKRQQAQPGAFPRCAQHFDQGLRTRQLLRLIDIKISLYPRPAAVQGEMRPAYATSSRWKARPMARQTTAPPICTPARIIQNIWPEVMPEAVHTASPAKPAAMAAKHQNTTTLSTWFQRAGSSLRR